LSHHNSGGYSAPPTQKATIAKRDQPIDRRVIADALNSGRCPQQRILIAMLAESPSALYRSLQVTKLASTREAIVRSMGRTGFSARVVAYIDGILQPGAAA
jgi:hypothetical protein